MSIIGQNILAGASAAGEAYTIDQSLRFNQPDSPALNRTFSAGDTTSWTFSAWTKRCDVPPGGTSQKLFGAYSDGSNVSDLANFDDSNDFISSEYVGGSTVSKVRPSAYYRDFAAWYHIVVVWDSDNGTAGDRHRVYFNGERITALNNPINPSSGQVSVTNSACRHSFSRQDSDEWYDGYIAEAYFIDGQSLTADSFGETNEDTNQWIPKEVIGMTYGTNGFYLKFEDTADLGNDSSGNGNDFTVSNLSAYDQVSDSPTNNFPTMNPLINPYTGLTYSEGNLQINKAAASWAQSAATMPLPNSGKWYWEINRATASGTGMVGIAGSDANRFWNSQNTMYLDSVANILFYDDAKKYIDSTATSYGVTWYDANIMAIALNLDDNEITLYKNNATQGTVTITGGILTAETIIPVDLIYGTEERDYNFGQNGTFNGSKTAGGNADDNGIGDFYYAPPAGFLAICTSNLADPAVALPTSYFSSDIWTGTGASKAITTGFQPDFVWGKQRNGTSSHCLMDSIRGLSSTLKSNTSAVVETASDVITSFDSDGFTLGTSATGPNMNGNTNTFVGWSWKGGGAPTVDNDNATGAMDANSVSLNGSLQAAYTPSGSPTIYPTRMSIDTTSGFSIVSYSGNSVAGATIPHGLSEAPNLVIFKRLTYAGNWIVGSDGLTSWDYYSDLAEETAEANYDFFNDVAPTASVIAISAAGAINYDNTISANGTYIAYCFHSVAGYSQIGYYTGNGLAGGPIIYTGFQPALVLKKRIDSATNWHITDNARNPYNVMDLILAPNSTIADQSSWNMDFLSNGFKIRDTSATVNADGGEYLYMAFAEWPLKYSNAR